MGSRAALTRLPGREEDGSQMRPRRVFAVVGVIVIGAVPAGAVALSADPFGAPEIADPTWRPATNFTDGVPFAGADGAGNMLLATIYRKPVSADDQLAVLERCGSGPVTWQRTVLTDAAGGVTPGRLLVSRNGTALATWRVAGGGTVRHYSSV